MSNQLQITGGAKVRSLEGVITGTTGVLSSLPINGSLGIPQLDVNGKILVSQLPNSVMEYLGTWDASTNTPTLVNGTGNAGDVYLCNVAGTVNFGAGPISFVVSDQVIYSGTIWQKASGTSGTVTSVGLSTNGNSITISNSPVTTSATITANFSGTNLQYVNGAGNLTTFPTLMTSVGLTMPTAFTVTNSPLTGSGGTIAVAGAGYASQYIRGDGTLATFPAVGGGGGGVNFYLNGSLSQGTVGGHTYYQMSTNAIIDTPVNFTTSVDGAIGYFLTDVSSPNQLKIPAGNWNFQLYFSSSSSGGDPNFYIEVYKYNTGTFTLIASNSATPEYITNGTTTDLYVTSVAMPLTTLLAADRIALRIYINHTSGRTITLHTQGSTLCEVLTTFASGISALNGLTVNTQYFATGTSGSDFNISSVTDTHTFNIPDASATARGVMTTGTQTIAGAKTFSGNLTANSFIKIGGGNLEFLKADGSVDSTAYVQSVTATSPLVRTGATNTPILSIPAATSSVNGYLTSTDWTTFNNKATVSGVSGRVAFYNGTNSLSSDSYFNFDSSTKRLSIGDFSVVVPPAALSMISTIGAWYNRNTANTVNYNAIGLYYGSTYGHLFQTERVGASSDYSRISFINNNTSFVLDEDYNVGINTRIPTPGTSGPGGVGLDIWGGSQTAALALHNTASGSTTSDGGRLYLVNAGNLLLRNLETGSVIVSADNGDVVLQAGGFEKLRAISGGNVSITGSLQQSAVTSAILKTSSTGVIVAAVAGTDYLAVGSAVTSVTGTSPIVSSGGTTPAISMAAATTSVSGYLTSTDWNTFNSKFTLPSLTAGSVLFSNGTTIAQDNAAFFWDDTNNRLGLGTNAPGSLLTLFGAGDNTYFNIQYTGGSIASIEAVGTSVSGHGVLNLGRAGTTNVVINGYGDSYFTGGNLGVGINSPTYRLHVSGTLGVTGAATFSSSITASSLVKSGGTSSQFLKADGTVDSSVYLTTSSAASSYVPLGRTLTINGLGYNLYNDQSWSVGTVTGSSSGSTSTRVAFWNSAINLTSSANLYWDNTNSRLGINKGVPTTALDVVGQGTFYQGTATLNSVAVALSGQADQSFSGTETNQYALIGMSGVYYSYAASDFTPNAASGHCGSASTIFKENTGSFLGHLSGYTASFNIAGTGSVTTLSGYRINTPKQWSVGAGHTLFSGTITTLAGVYIDNLRGDSTINAHTTNSWGIYQSGASDNNYFAGKVLIGTNTVGAYALDVTGTGRFTTGLNLTETNGTWNFGGDTYATGVYKKTGGNNLFQFTYGGTDNGSLNIYSGGVSKINLYAGGVSYFNAGNVGIGTASPNDLLQVGSSTTRGTMSIVGTSSGVPVLQLNNTNAASGRAFNLYVGNAAAGSFSIYDTTASLNRFIIDSTGAATFSSSVTAGGFVVGVSGTYKVVTDTNTTLGYLIRSGSWKGSSENMLALAAETGYGISLFTNGLATERMTITSGGDVLMGTTNTNPAGGNTAGLAVQNGGLLSVSRDGNPCAFFNRQTSNGEIMRFYYAGSQVGSISTNANSLPSDLNFKKDITDISLGLNFVTKLRPVHYRYKLDEENEALSNGVIAQEMEQALLDCGIEKNSLLMLQHKPNEDETQSQYWLDYTKMIPVLIKAIQEQQEQITELKQIVATK